jgi:hypothetical protein
LKPKSVGLNNSFKIKYIIYKGILKSSLIDPNDQNKIAPFKTNDLIDAIWDSTNNMNAKAGTNLLPSIKSLGLNFDSTATGFDKKIDSDRIDDVFFHNGSSFSLQYISAGDKIGVFNQNSFGIEIILENSFYTPTFKILRTHENIITVPNLGTSTNALKIEDIFNRQKILGYIDPVTFFSLYYQEGVNCFTSGTSTRLSKLPLYQNVLAKFKNCNRIYVDIRNENNFYFNFYGNYGDTIKLNLGSVTTNVVFKTNLWPIKIIENTEIINTISFEKNTIKIQVPEGDNNSPLIYQDLNRSVLSHPEYVPPHRQKFLNITYQSGYSNDISCISFNADAGSVLNVSNYVRLFYIRKQSNEYIPSNSSVVYSTLTHFDNLFTLLPQSVNFESANAVNSILLGDFRYIEAIDDIGFAGIVQTGFCEDNDRIVFFAIPIDIHISNNLETEKIMLFTGGVSNHLSFFDSLPFKGLVKNVTNINGDSAKLISLDEKKERNVIDSYSENIFCLSLTKTEYNFLITMATSSFNLNHHPVYLSIDSVSHLEDSSSHSIPYSSLSLCLRGLNTSAVSTSLQSSFSFITNSGTIIMTPEASLSEVTTWTDPIAYKTSGYDSELNFGVTFRLGANQTGNKWPLYNKDGTQQTISSSDNTLISLPLATRVTVFKSDFVNNTKLNKRAFKIYTWYSSTGYEISGFRLGYIDYLSYRSMVYPRETPTFYKDYKIEIIESFLQDLELYLCITLENMKDKYSGNEYGNYVKFVNSLSNLNSDEEPLGKVKQFRNDFEAAINSYPTDPTLVNALYDKLKLLFNEEVYSYYNINRNTNIPLNKLTSGEFYGDNKVSAAIEYLEILKSTNIFNNRFSIFVKQGVTSFVLSMNNQTVIIQIGEDIESGLETSFKVGLASLFNVSEFKNLFYDESANNNFYRNVISDDVLNEANGITFTFKLKHEFKTQDITCDSENVIVLPNNIVVMPLSYKWANSNGAIAANFISNLYGSIDSDITEVWTLLGGNSGRAIGPYKTVIHKAIFTRLANYIWDLTNSTENFVNLRLTKEAIWLKDYFYNSTLANSISHFIVLENLTWAESDNSRYFFEHHGSFVGIDQSIGVLNSNPVFSTLIHEANQLMMVIDLNNATDTHNPNKEFFFNVSKQTPYLIWNSQKDTSSIDFDNTFFLYESMSLLDINYHLPLIYIHYYLTKIYK